MRLLVAVFVVAPSLVLVMAAAAQSEHLAHREGTSAANPDTTMTNGSYAKSTRQQVALTVAHEASTNRNMPKMTMTFMVKEGAWLDGLKEGGRIRFVAQKVNGRLTVVALEHAK